MATQLETPPAGHNDETIQLNGWALWALGIILGGGITLFVALAMLAGRTSTPEYTAVPGAPTTAAPLEAVADLTLAATDFAFAPNPSAVLTAGTITMKNEGFTFHNLLVEGIEGFVIEADPGTTSSSTVVMPAGTYTIFCSVAGHRELGMEASLIVEDG